MFSVKSAVCREIWVLCALELPHSELCTGTTPAEDFGANTVAEQVSKCSLTSIQIHAMSRLEKGGERTVAIVSDKGCRLAKEVGGSVSATSVPSLLLNPLGKRDVNATMAIRMGLHQLAIDAGFID